MGKIGLESPRWIRRWLSSFRGPHLTYESWNSFDNIYYRYEYHIEWDDDHKERFLGPQDPGIYQSSGSYLGRFIGHDIEKWVSYTPGWDKRWFRRQGIRPPKHIVRRSR